MPKAPVSPKKKNNRKSQRTDGGSYTCTICGSSVRNRGKSSHNKACKPPFHQLQPDEAQDRTNLQGSPVPVESNSNHDNGMMEVDEQLGLHTPMRLVAQHIPEEHIFVDIQEADEHSDAMLFNPLTRHFQSVINLSDSGGSETEAGSEIGSVMEDDLINDDIWVPLSMSIDANITVNKSAIHVSTYKRNAEDPSPDANDIRVEHHPRSGIKPLHYSFYDYEPFGLSANNPEKHIETDNQDQQEPPVSESLPGTSSMENQPWIPFSMQLDFDIADFILDASLSNSQTDTLLHLIRRCISDPVSLTLYNHKDIRNTWDAARVVHNTSSFKQHTIEIPYPKPESETYVTFDTWIKPLWDWLDEITSDPTIAKDFHWNAERVFKYSIQSESYERCISEPWTADAWWDAQSKIPEGGLPLCIILYADKTQLSSFGTAKAYPVMARCANLPIELRNGKGIAGGRLVGWLPIVKEDAGETGKKNFINLKRVVWHESFKILLESIRQYSKTGITKVCGDNIVRCLYPIILILSADYEEQCYMATIRGLNSAHPCPICLVSHNNLCNLSQKSVLRTSEAMQQVYQAAQTAIGVPGEGKAKVKDKLLKQYGLRNVENTFWSLRYTDVYSALSWDRLHAYHGGLFSHHLWDLFKTNVDSLGKEAGKLIDLQVDQIPRWRGLNHFSSIIKTGEYTDGGKHEGMSKIIVFASHNVLSRGATEWGYLLLQLIRSYLELDMYSSLLIHTEETISRGRQEMVTFETILERFKEVYTEKNWNFPKMHTHTHMFDDIRNKGATRNYNTKPNENAHRPLKAYYKRTNYKDIERQILRIHEDHLVSLTINTKILDIPLEINDPEAIEPPDSEHLDQASNSNNMSVNIDNSDAMTHIVLGSCLSETSLKSLESEKSLPLQPLSPSQRVHHKLTAPSKAEAAPDFSLAFQQLRKKTANALSSIISLQCGKVCRVVLSPDHLIEPYQYMKVHYESVVDWEHKIDHLRVNPSFHHRDRHDFVLVQTDPNKFCFAQLIYMFKISYNEKIYPLALILPLDSPAPPTHRTRNKDLRFTRVVARSKALAVVIDVHCITRGALLIQDYSADNNGTYIVVDVIDADMWWRMKSINLVQKVRFA